MIRTLSRLSLLALLLTTPGSSFAAGNGILHGVVTNGAGQPVTGLTAVVTHLSGQFPFSESQELTAGGEFVVNPTVGSYLVELRDGDENVVAYRHGMNIFNNITTFVFFTTEGTGSCQQNLGFASPSGLSLSLCGDDLTTAGSSATLDVFNAITSSTVYLAIGLDNDPTPFKGGTLVPFPWLTLLPLGSDIFGRVSLTAPGGTTTPVTLYMQVIDPNTPAFRFSNGIEVQIGL